MLFLCTFPHSSLMTRHYSPAKGLYLGTGATIKCERNKHFEVLTIVSSCVFGRDTVYVRLTDSQARVSSHIELTGPVLRGGARQY